MHATTISDGKQLSVTLLDYGARIIDITFNGVAVALKYKSLDDYLHDPYYLGASIGPITNRVSRGQVSIDGQRTFQLPQNEGENTLHSGGNGFDKQLWQRISKQSDQVQYQLVYPLSDIGMEGVLTVIASYQVQDGTLTISYESKCDTSTFINLTNHVYLNLEGEGDLKKHQFELFAESYVEVDKQNIPTGTLINITSPMNYKIDDSPQPELIGACDHHFNMPPAASDARLMLVAHSEKTGLSLEVSGNSPGFQFYTGKFLGEPFIASRGFCVETQLPPDAINQSNFDAPLLAANQRQLQTTTFTFC